MSLYSCLTSLFSTNKAFVHKIMIILSYNINNIVIYNNNNIIIIMLSYMN